MKNLESRIVSMYRSGCESCNGGVDVTKESPMYHAILLIPDWPDWDDWDDGNAFFIQYDYAHTLGMKDAYERGFIVGPYSSEYVARKVLLKHDPTARNVTALWNKYGIFLERKFSDNV